MSIALQGLIAKMGKTGAAEVLRSHRETHMTKAKPTHVLYDIPFDWAFFPGSDQADFQRVRSCGLNAVRLPFGYWVVTEPRQGVGPNLQILCASARGPRSLMSVRRWSTSTGQSLGLRSSGLRNWTGVVKCLHDQEFDLQIVLDLHGCPGGESPEAGKWRVLHLHRSYWLRLPAAAASARRVDGTGSSGISRPD